MSDEQTPLIRTVYVGPPRRRAPQGGVCRRFCTIAISSILIFTFASFIVGLFVQFPDDWEWHWPHHRHGHGRYLRRPETITHEQLQLILHDTPSSQLAEEWSWYYTAGPHLAGQNYSQVG